ncbi:MAG: aminopeptidase P family protein [Saprospiraceae bacterium]|jgi:Xaa-Pro aminopeptidase|nr:aminopeptidase P family protein [Saprospiraceae bacterium]
MNTNQKLTALRKAIKKDGIHGIIIPSSDPHQSEYVSAHWQERTWISGFTGSAGIVVVTADHAGLWTDSRYFLQGEMQLKGSEMVLHKMYNQFASPYVDFLASELPKGSKVAVNGMMFSKSTIESFYNTLSSAGIELLHRTDLISEVWLDRPPLSDAPVLFHEDKFSGKSISTKLSEIRAEMSQRNADYHLITALDDFAWSLNVRGNDVDYNPVAIAYAVIGKSDSHVFIHQDKLSAPVKSQWAKNNIVLHDYDQIVGFLNKLPEKTSILVDPIICSQTLYEAINAQIVHGTSIPKGLKAIKNDTETKHLRSVMKKDGAALANTFYWLEQSLAEGTKIDEVTVAKKLAENRSHQKFYHGESFGAIIGYKDNGAVIHYHPEPETCKTIDPEGILLVDSGGQYSDGTTDITRTFALSTPTDEQKKAYTLILKGMIALSRAKFPEGTTGAQLDTLARQFLWAEGMNYLHGTGHGVGFFLNVHEAPQGFGPVHSERGRTVHLPGMLSSNEPGYYKDGEFGMRIENLILAVKSDIPGFLEFDTYTLYPFDHVLIDKPRLTKDEISWINNYHKTSYAGIAPLLKGEVKEWFKNKCRKV